MAAYTNRCQSLLAYRRTGLVLLPQIGAGLVEGLHGKLAGFSVDRCNGFPSIWILTDGDTGSLAHGDTVGSHPGFIG